MDQNAHLFKGADEKLNTLVDKDIDEIERFFLSKK
jgi:hypothetical protein